MNLKEQQIKLFLLDTRARIESLELAFPAEGFRNVTITSYDEKGISKTPITTAIESTSFSTRLPSGFEIYMLHPLLTTSEAILDLRKRQPSAFIWLNRAEDPRILEDKLKQTIDGYYDSERPDDQARKIMGTWRDALR